MQSRILIVMFSFIVYLSASAFAATLTSAYEFEGNLQDSVINGVDPSMVTGTRGYGNGSVVNGEFVFGFGQGLELTNGFANINSYSVELYFRFDNVTGYRNIFDPGSSRNDKSLYVYNSQLKWYPLNHDTSSNYISANTYHHIVMTRDSNGSLYGYVDGVMRINNVNAGTDAQVTGNVAHFFEDNASSEMSAGAAKYITIYDGILSQTEVAQLYQSRDAAVPEPSCLILLTIVSFIVLSRQAFPRK